MTLVKFSPRFPSYVPDYFDNLVDELLRKDHSSTEKKSAFVPKADIAEGDSDYQIYLELPGVDKKDIQINLDEDKLIVSGTKAPVYDETLKLHSRETYYGSFERSFYLSKEVKADKISASFDQGVLKITIPKQKETQVKRTISVN